MNVFKVQNPIYAKADKQSIDCLVTFEKTPAIPAIPAKPAQDAIIDENDNILSPAIPAEPGSPAVPAIYYDAMPFTATSYDVELHGREIFERCVAGEFGPIAAYVAPPPPPPAPTKTDLIAEFNAKVGQLAALKAAIDGVA